MSMKKHHSALERQAQMDEIYEKLPPEAIPWNTETPPKLLVELVEKKQIIPGKTLDLGCGAGNYAIYLATHGFDVTGIDISPVAIKLAQKNAKRKKVDVEFKVADLLGDLVSLKTGFDFMYDWNVLHHLFPEQRMTYVEKVAGLLKKGGIYLSVCFHESDPQFGGKGKYRTTDVGTRLYFSNQEEMKKLFESRFQIIENKIIEVPAKTGYHVENYFLLKRV
jgi:SAM-dependent methyltransferase